MWFHSLGEKNGEQEDTEHLDSLCLALLATKQVESSSEHCIDGEHYSGRTCLPQFAVCKVCTGSMLSHKVLAPGASAGYGRKLISLKDLEVQRSVSVWCSCSQKGQIASSLMRKSSLIPSPHLIHYVTTW